MWQINKGLIRGRSAFVALTPGPLSLFNLSWIGLIKPVPALVSDIVQGKPVHELIGNLVGHFASKKLFQDQIKALVKRSLLIAQERPNWKLFKLGGLGATRRSFVSGLDRSLVDGRIVKELTIVYHHANKAGKHIDVHIGATSMVYRVTGKPVEEKIAFNNKGMLTEASKEALLDHVRAEIKMNARVPQNHDHTVSNARASWAYDPSLANSSGYGEGPTRQIILSDKVEYYHPDVKSSLHMYAPKLNPDQGLYTYQIYPGSGKSAPILIFGNLIPRDEAFKDRLHLKMIQDADFEKDFLRRIDHDTVSRKYDGASCYITGSGEVENHHSFKVFSPRMSTKTGHRIEYTYKIAEIADKGINVKTQSMGELMFWERTTVGRMLAPFGIRGPEVVAWNYLPASSIAGILNSNEVRSRSVFPEIRLYRVDKWNGQNVNGLPFFENRELQQQIVDRLQSPFLKVVKLVRPTKNTNWEGLVGVPEGLSVNDGLKVKWWADANDWKVESVELKLSDKGNVSGVVWFRSLESDKLFKLGPGGLGGVDRQLEFMDNPLGMVGRVFKVHGRNGHEGRAAKIVDPHMDKGIM